MIAIRIMSNEPRALRIMRDLTRRLDALYFQILLGRINIWR